MEKDIIDGKIGEVGAYDLEFKKGKLSFKIGVAHKSGIEVELVASLGAKALLETIKVAAKKAISGETDDAIFDTVFGFLEKALLEPEEKMAALAVEAPKAVEEPKAE